MHHTGDVVKYFTIGIVYVILSCAWIHVKNNVEHTVAVQFGAFALRVLHYSASCL